MDTVTIIIIIIEYIPKKAQEKVQYDTWNTTREC